MTTPESEQALVARWEAYYRGVHAGSRPWLDLSNEAVWAQTVALALEAAGPIEGRRCLDGGSGSGRLATCLEGLGADAVVALDLVGDTIDACRRRYPAIRWESGSITDAQLVASLGDFDVVFLVEVLQYVPWESAIAALWGRVRPGGRLVGVVPNRDDPIVQRAAERFDGAYRAPTYEELARVASALAAVDHWAVRGIAFQDDQRLAPYVAGPWLTDDPLTDPANRLVFAIRKREEARR